MPETPLEALLLAWLPRLGLGLAVAAAFWLAGVAARGALLRVAARMEAGRDAVVRLLGRVAHLGLVLVGAVSGLGTLGVDVGALVAGLGLTGFAVGFALRDALSNLLAGVLILLYQPFRCGDRIQVAGKEGVVRWIDLRYTTLEDEGGRVLVPNGVLLTQTVRVREDGGADGP